MGNLLYDVITDFFGVITEEMPNYEQVDKTDKFEIRQYGPTVAVETTFRGKRLESKESREAFWALAGYIGALSAPKNVKPGAGTGGEAIAMTTPVVMQNAGEKIAMTAPVIMENAGEKIAMTAPVTMESAGEKIAMTAPVVMEDSGTGGDSQELQVMRFFLPSKYNIHTAPQPTDPRVAVKELPGKKVGAIVFNGTGTGEVVAKKAEKLKEDLEAAGHKTKGTFVSAFYNSPFSIPYFRRNEVWFELEN